MRTPPSSPWQQARRRLCKNRGALLGLGVFITLFACCLFGPLLTPYDYNTQNLDMGAVAPNAQHWFGTDILGRDLLTRTLHGGRVSFLVGIIATAVSLGIGVVYGTLSGYVGGRLDRLMMRIVDIIYALPFVIFVILLMTLFGRSMGLLFAAIGLVEWLTMARIVRGQVLSLRQQTFVQAATCMGQSHANIMRQHLLPNLIGVIIVYTTLTIPNVMLLEAFISFLGLGVQAPDTSWGDLIQAGTATLESHPWQLFFPALFFALTLLSLNFLGDGLRDAFDPKTSE